MARRVVCCATEAQKYEYLYVDTAGLAVENITDEVSALVSDARSRCCLDDLAGYALGKKSLDETQQDLFSFDFYKLNSFELFKDTEELRLKTGSEKILHSCLLNYYRREYDGTQQHTFFSDPAVSNTYVRTSGGVEHELTLEEREFIRNKPEEEQELETLDKGKSDAEREAEAAQAQAELEQQEALAEAEAKAEKQEKRDKARKDRQRRMEDERYREFRNQDNVQSAEYQRLRQYEEEMRRNNDYLQAQYNSGNYSSLPGYMAPAAFSEAYESGRTETLGLAVENADLYNLASRMEEFNVPYTVSSDTLSDGRQISLIYYSSDYADRASNARDFFELERTLRYDDIVPDHSYFNAYQLNALEYAYQNNIDTFYVSNGAYSGNQMFRILDAGLNGQDMSVLANPSYTTAHMDVLSHYMNFGWDTAPIQDSTLSPSTIADNLIQQEQRAGISVDHSFFASHDYDAFMAYGSLAVGSSFFNGYDNTQQQKYYQQMESANKAAESRENFETYKENLHTSYEQRQREMNYISDNSGTVTGGGTPEVSTVPGAVAGFYPTSGAGDKYVPSAGGKQDGAAVPITRQDGAPVAAGKSSSDLNGRQGGTPMASGKSSTVSDAKHHVVPVLGVPIPGGKTPVTQATGGKHDASVGVRDKSAHFGGSSGSGQKGGGAKVAVVGTAGSAGAGINPANAGYTPTGYTSKNGSFKTYGQSKMPFVSKANTGAGMNAGGAPVKAPPSQRAPGRKHQPLDNLKVRGDFARKAGLRVQNFGNRLVGLGTSSLRGSFRTIARVANNDDTNTVSAYQSSRRNAANVAFAAALVCDLPRQFTRAGQGIRYASNAVGNVGRVLMGDKARKYEPCKVVSVKQARKEVSDLQKKQFNDIKAKYGATAAKMNVKEINQNIHRLEKERSALIKQNQALKQKMGAANKNSPKSLKQKYKNSSDKKALDKKIKKKSQEIEKLKDLKKQKKADCKALRDPKKRLEKLGKKAGRWKLLPGRLGEGFVSQLQKGGDEAISVASSHAMRLVRNPVFRLAKGATHLIIVRPMAFVGRKLVVQPVKKVVTKTVIKPVTKVVRKRVRKTKVYRKYRLRKIKRAQFRKKIVNFRKKIGNNVKRGVEKVIGKKAYGMISKAAKFTQKAKAAAFRAFNSFSNFFAAAKKMLIKFALAGAAAFMGILLIVTIIGSIAQTTASVVPGLEKDNRIKLDHYTQVINAEQSALEVSIIQLANGKSSTGQHYDNVFYDYNGKTGNNTAELLAMASVRFSSSLEDNKSAVDAYLQQLYKDSNYMDYAESEPYSCDNGCVTRTYFCYSEYDKYATETRKSLKAASNHSGDKNVDSDAALGCIPTTYNCMEKAVLGYHNDGKWSTKKCDCKDVETELVVPWFLDSKYSPLYGSEEWDEITPPPGYEDYTGSSEERITVYLCLGYKGETYNKNGCKKHNDGEAMDQSCSCYNCKEKKERVKVKNEDGKVETITVTKYYCQGYCDHSHKRYSCGGHSESVCYGKHQDLTITITSLGFDEIFAADSSVAQAGTTVRGTAYADKFVVTAYCPCHECCHPYDQACTGKPPTTASGTKPKANHTIAVDPNVIPIGTHVWIGGQEYVAEDKGTAIKGNRIDIYFDSHSKALQWGKRTMTVYSGTVVSDESAFKVGADEYGFDGWTNTNKDVAKNLYKGLTSSEADTVYSGLDIVRDLSFGSSESTADLSGIVFDKATGLTSKQRNVLAVIEGNRIATTSGKCQAWVADVYQAALGGLRLSKCCANHAGEAWGASNDWSKIQVGATVYGYSNSLYGHVGIYIGDGKVAHNIGYLKIQSLESWVRTYNGKCWGWNGANNLTGNSQYNCKSSGTFMKGKD